MKWVFRSRCVWSWIPPKVIWRWKIDEDTARLQTLCENKGDALYESWVVACDCGCKRLITKVGDTYFSFDPSYERDYTVSEYNWVYMGHGVESEKIGCYRDWDIAFGFIRDRYRQKRRREVYLASQ